MNHKRAVIPLLIFAIAAIVVTASAQPRPGNAATQVRLESAEDRLQPKRHGWIKNLRAGKDARPIYAAMLESPEAGGFFYAAELELLCASVAMRDAPTTKSTHQQDPNAPEYGEYLTHMQRLRGTCSSMHPDEANIERAGSRYFSANQRERDPILALKAALRPAGSEAERRRVLRQLVDLGPPTNLWLLGGAMLQSAGGVSYMTFDGKRFEYVRGDIPMLDGTPTQLSAALDLAACDLGLPCGNDSIAAARSCMEHFRVCREPDFPAMVRRQVQLQGYADFEKGWTGVERIRRRLVAAIRTRDHEAFTSTAK